MLPLALWYSAELRSVWAALGTCCTVGAGRRALRADCVRQMQLPKAFVSRQLIFGINANPHYKSFARFVCDSVWLRRGFVAVCGTCYAGHWAGVLLALLVALLFCGGYQVCLGARRISSDGRRIFLRGSAPAKLWDRVGICAAIAARGLARRLRRARVSALPVTQLESAPPRSFAGAFSLFFRRHS